MKSESLPDDDLRFDRLADGELSPEEYRALVGGLDQEPGGWRSCALALLESQALARELGGLRQAADLRPATAVAAPAKKAASFHLSSGTFPPGTLLAMAASFALAFGLGVALPGIWSGGRQDEVAGGNLTNSAELVAGAGGERHEAQRPIGNVRLVMNGAGGEQTDAGEVPVYEIGQNLDEYLAQNPPALDPWLLQWLQQEGHRVEVQQQLVPGQLEDGRSMYVPVDQYRITPVKRSY